MDIINYFYTYEAQIAFFLQGNLIYWSNLLQHCDYSTMVYYLKETCAKLVHIYNICFLI